MGRYVISFLLYLWQLPQNLVGLVYMLITKGENRILEQRWATFYTSPTISGGVSLGNYVFISPEVVNKDPVYDHEFGHCIQSRILGPLYLPIVGLCSGIHFLLHKGGNYYTFWTESWANRLGGISGYAGEYHYHKPGLIITSIEWLRK